RGPAINLTLTYNQKDNQQPANPDYSNFGPKWTFNWLSYVVDSPTQDLAAIFIYLPGGGAEVYSFDSVTQKFSIDPQSHAQLVRTDGHYERHLPDGSRQVFNHIVGSTYPRRFFLTEITDPAENTV